jgi:fatty-acyl-CoA synthase
VVRISLASVAARLLLNRLRTTRAVARFAWRVHRRHTALIDRRGTWTYDQLHQRVMRLSGWLQDQGLPERAVVFTWLPETGELYEVRLATFETGHVFAPCHSHLPPEFVLELIERVQPAVLVHDPALSATLLRQAQTRWPTMRMLALGGDYERALATSRPRSGVARVHEDDIFALHMTSGTTGAPKAVGFTHRKYLDSMRMVARAVDFRRPPGGRDVNMLGLPITGPGSGLVLPTLLSGATLVMPETFEASTLARLVARHRVTRAFLSPSAIIDLLDLDNLEQHDLSSLTFIAYGAEMMPAAKIAEAIRRIGPIFQQGYGSLEALPPISWLLPAEHIDALGAPLGRNVLGSVGRPAPGVEVVVRDEDFRPLPHGRTGLITVRSLSCFDGYWNDALKTANTLRDGWVVIGDHGQFDADGRLHVLGREADRVRRGDHWIHPRDVEEIAHEHAAIKEACLVQQGTRAVLAVSLRRAAPASTATAAQAQHAQSTEDILAHVQRHLPAHLWPDEVTIVPAIPRSFLNKVLRREVRAMLDAQSAQRVVVPARPAITSAQAA